MSDELPQGWAATRLGQVATFIMGQAPPSADTNKDGHGTPFVKAGEFGAERPVIREWTTRPLKQARETDVLICVVGATCGKLNLGAECAIGRSVAAIRPRNGLDQLFLWRYLQTRVMALREASSGSAQGVISQELLAREAIPLPPLAEQRRIVERIEALFARTRRARTDLLRIAPLAANLSQALLDLAALGELSRVWRSETCAQPSAEAALARVRAGRGRSRKSADRYPILSVPDVTLPDTWTWTSPDEVADDGKHTIGIGPFGSNLVQADYRSEGVRLVFVRDIRRRDFGADGAKYVTAEKAAELAPHAVHGGEVLITKMGDPPGDTAIYPEDNGPAVITADCIKLRAHPELALSSFLAHAIRSRLVSTQIKEITAGVAHQKVSLERFRQIALPLPPISEQAELVRELDRFSENCTLAEREATRALALLDHLEQSILARAFRGDLVPQDPTDEPAPTTLARLAATTPTTTPRRRRASGT